MGGFSAAPRQGGLRQLQTALRASCRLARAPLQRAAQTVGVDRLPAALPPPLQIEGTHTEIDVPGAAEAITQGAPPCCCSLFMRSTHAPAAVLSTMHLPAPPPAAKKVLIVPGYGLAVANAQVRRPVGWWGLRCPVPCAPHLALAQALP